MKKNRFEGWTIEQHEEVANKLAAAFRFAHELRSVALAETPSGDTLETALWAAQKKLEKARWKFFDAAIYSNSPEVRVAANLIYFDKKWDLTRKIDIEL